MKEAVQVTILGQQYTVRSQGSAEEVRQVAEFVNGKIAEVKQAGRADTLDTAVLALLNVAGAYVRLKVEGEASEKRLRELVTRLDEARCCSTKE